MVQKMKMVLRLNMCTPMIALVWKKTKGREGRQKMMVFYASVRGTGILVEYYDSKMVPPLVLVSQKSSKKTWPEIEGERERAVGQGRRRGSYSIIMHAYVKSFCCFSYIFPLLKSE